MIARISLSVFLATCVLWPSTLSAQWASPGAAPIGGYAPPGSPVQFAGGYAPQPGVDYFGDGSGGVYCPPGMEGQPQPWERDGKSPIRSFLKTVVPATYFRLEYLSWDVDDVGAAGIGEDSQFIIDQRGRIPFGIVEFERLFTNDLVIPTAESITFNKTSGVRGTLGIPLQFGVFEFSAWGLEDMDEGIANAIPGPTTVGTFTVPAGQFLVVPPPVSLVSFPLDVDEIAIPPAPFSIFVPPAAPGMLQTLPTDPGDIFFPGVIFNVLNTTAVAIPLTQNGQPGLTALLYDVAYAADYHGEVWGTEAKMIFEWGPNFNSMSLRPLVGFRYMSFDEEFRQVGISTLQSNIVRNEGRLWVNSDPLFDPIGTTQITRRSAPRASIIDSETENTLFGLQLGTRVEYDHKWFSLGVEPRISLGLNSYDASVTTTNLRSAADGVFRTEDDDLSFAPIFDVHMYGKIHLTPNFSLHAGYNFTYLFQVTRPVDNIVYNDNGPGAPPGVVLDAETVDAHIEGLTIGGEFRFRELKLR